MSSVGFMVMVQHGQHASMSFVRGVHFAYPALLVLVLARGKSTTTDLAIQWRSEGRVGEVALPKRWQPCTDVWQTELAKAFCLQVPLERRELTKRIAFTTLRIESKNENPQNPVVFPAFSWDP